MVRLEQPSLENCSKVVEWAQDPKLSDYFRRYPPIQDWHQPEQIIAGLGVGYMVVEDDKVVGLAQLLNNDARAGSVEMAMLVDKGACKEPEVVASKAYIMLCDYIFEYLNYQKIYMKVLESSKGLQKYLINGKFKQEGYFKRSCRYKGELVGEIMLSLFKEDYKQWDREQHLARKRSK
jgi:RimJ/RimL family protein N-acetyltransferase